MASIFSKKNRFEFMDTAPVESLTLVFREAKMARAISLELLSKYPNCPLLIGWKETGNNQVCIYDMVPEEFTSMIHVVNGTVPIHQCNARIRELLDSYGFVDKLEHRVHAALLSEEPKLVAKLTPFYDAISHCISGDCQTNIMLCSSQEEYVHCKDILKGPNVIPIQVLTIGNHLLFCSCAQGTPLVNVMRKQATGNRMDNIPAGAALTSSGLIKASLQQCQYIISGNIPVPPVVHGPVGPTGAHGPVGAMGPGGYQPPTHYCGYCGTANCYCPGLVLSLCQNITCPDEVVYFNTMFELTQLWMSNKLPHTKPAQSQPDPVCLLNEDRQQVIRVVACSHKWSDAPAIRSMIFYPLGELAKLSMYLGFVRI